MLGWPNGPRCICDWGGGAECPKASLLEADMLDKDGVAGGAARGCCAGDATRCCITPCIAWSLILLGAGFGSSGSLFKMDSKFERFGASAADTGTGGWGAGGAEKTELDLGSSRFVGDGLNGILLAKDDTGAGARLLKAGESMLLRGGLADDWKKPLGGDAGRDSTIGFRSWGMLSGWFKGD